MPDGSQVTPDEHEELVRLRRENRILRVKRDIQKKRRRSSRWNRSEFRVENACGVLNVSPSGYYAWSSRMPSEREIDDARLIDKIRVIYDASCGVYDVRRIHRKLLFDGEPCSRNRVARLMRKCDIHASRKGKYRVTTDSKRSFPVADNLLVREFFSAGPNQVWVSDITYIWTLEGWLYLAAIIDLHSRRVHHRKYRSRGEARMDIFGYIEVFYNRVRLHSTLGYLSPAQFESQTLIKAAWQSTITIGYRPD